jgi:hypothetical protein
MLEELERTPPPFSFVHDSTLQHRDPLIPERVELPQLSQLELANLRNTWAGLDGIRLALASQGAQLAAVTNRLHSAETKIQQAEAEVSDLKRKASAHPEEENREVKKPCLEAAVRQICELQQEHRESARIASSQHVKIWQSCWYNIFIRLFL